MGSVTGGVLENGYEGTRSSYHQPILENGEEGTRKLDRRAIRIGWRTARGHQHLKRLDWMSSDLENGEKGTREATYKGGQRFVNPPET